jgi:Secretion system C-terminal sorting domain
MKKLILLPLLLSLFTVNAQTTAIPDANFEQELIAQGLDSGPIDGVVLTNNIDTLTYLYVIGKSISDLTGIQDFTALTHLYCMNNLLANLDVTQNTNLIDLFTYNNPFLTSLDVSQNTSLDRLDTENCALTTLDVSQNPLITVLLCHINQLECLILTSGGNTNIITLAAQNNPNLTCVEVDDVAYSNLNWSTSIDVGASYSSNCGPCTVGIDELLSSSISIHPNPTNGQLTISLEEGTASAITIRNSLGQLMLSDKYSATKQLGLDISNFPIGVYFIQIETDGEVITKKIVKQ